MHGLRRQVLAVEQDRAVVGHDEADDHVERRGLAGAVRSEQANHFTALDFDVTSL